MCMPFTKEILCPVFRAFPEPVGSQRTLPQSFPYAKEAYLEVAYSGAFHYLFLATETFLPSFVSTVIREQFIEREKNFLWDSKIGN